jgi:hypothetical protein
MYSEKITCFPWCCVYFMGWMNPYILPHITKCTLSEHASNVPAYVNNAKVFSLDPLFNFDVN